MHRSRAGIALVGVLGLVAACIPPVPTEPTAGYGAPYKGTGAPIYVKDSRTDWTIAEGDHPITSEKALEATGDQEYEARRQIAKDYNVKLYREGLVHRSRGTIMIDSSIAVLVVGLAIAAFLPNRFEVTTVTPATATTPEMRSTKPGGSAKTAEYAGIGLASLGGLGVLYGYFGGKAPPPYHRWHTPGPLDHASYVRQQTEPYNEKIGAPSISGQSNVDDLPLAPGQRRPPPVRPAGPPKTNRPPTTGRPPMKGPPPPPARPPVRRRPPGGGR